MWRIILVAYLVADVGVGAAVFSEGGSGAGNKAAKQSTALEEQQQEEMAIGEQLKEQYLEFLAQQEEDAAREEAEREEQEKALADEIYREAQMDAMLAELQQQAQLYDQVEEDEKEISPREVPSAPLEEEKIAVAPKEEEQATESENVQGEKIDESVQFQPNDKAIDMQKKGQSEFVSFVDPEASKILKSVPSAEKRKSIEKERIQGTNKGGHLLFIAVGCVMSVGMVGALVGGLIRYRKNREEPDDQEYAPYAGTGPRNKKPIKGEKGDDTLAYKAQLHHYQQAKQKIICGEDNAGVAGDSDEETDEIDDENNFSVYECPGLAPTGDIEVHNPNFAVDRP